MSIPNVATLYQKIGKGSEGGHEFARIINLLFTADSRECGYQYINSSDASGDYKGVDAIMKRKWQGVDKYFHTGLQFKFYPSNLSSAHKQEIRHSLVNAVEKYPEMTNWILVTPEDFSKRDMEWFESLKKEFEFKLSLEELAENFMNDNEPVRNKLKLFHWGHTEIISIMLQNPSVGRCYYGFDLFPHEIGKLVFSSISVDTINTIWYRSGHNPNHYLRLRESQTDKSSELIFDFQFINNSELIYHLQQIDVIIEQVWTKLKGIPADQIIKSIGTIEFALDFSKKVNSIILNHVIRGPIEFKNKESKRFGLQLNKFMEKCPGNMAELRFEFLFNHNYKLSSEIVLLDF